MMDGECNKEIRSELAQRIRNNHTAEKIWGNHGIKLATKLKLKKPWYGKSPHMDVLDHEKRRGKNKWL